MRYGEGNEVIAQRETDYPSILCRLVCRKWAIQELLRGTLGPTATAF